jgi:hypothetical protein
MQLKTCLHHDLQMCLKEMQVKDMFASQDVSARDAIKNVSVLIASKAACLTNKCTDVLVGNPAKDSR